MTETPPRPPYCRAQYTCQLDEGRVELEMPNEPLSADSCQDFVHFIQGIVAQAKRRSLQAALPRSFLQPVCASAPRDAEEGK